MAGGGGNCEDVSLPFSSNQNNIQIKQFGGLGQLPVRRDHQYRSMSRESTTVWLKEAPLTAIDALKALRSGRRFSETPTGTSLATFLPRLEIRISSPFWVRSSSRLILSLASLTLTSSMSPPLKQPVNRLQPRYPVYLRFDSLADADG